MISALALALALLIAPGAPRRRIGASKRFESKGIRWYAAAIGAAGLCVVAVALEVPWPVVAAAVLAAVTLTGRTLRTRRARRHVQEALELQGALAVLVGELRAGAHPVAAFDTAAAEVDGPVSTGLREVAARARLGADVPGGLKAVACASSMPTHWDRLAVYWQLAQDHGLAIAALMRAAERDVVARERFSSRVRSGMAGARATASVLAGLPLLGIGLGQLIGANPLRFLFGDGSTVLLVGVGLSCLGLAWSDRITTAVLR